MIYFVDCKTKEEIEQRYKGWCKILHPDKDGGNTKQFQAMQQEYIDIKTGKTTDKAKPHKKVVYQSPIDRNNDIIQKTNEFIGMAGNLVTLVRSGISLAKEINTLIEIDEQVENLKNNPKNES